MTKFLNISTDTTLGGNAPSDELAVSQKAIKTYVDNHSGGGGSSTLAGLSDVTITSATNGQVLTYDNGDWINAPSASSFRPDLFDWKWADHELNDVQWLRGDTFSWQDGGVYQAAYNHLVDDIPQGPLAITTSENTVYVRNSDDDVAGAAHPYCWAYNSTNYYTVSETPSANDSIFLAPTGKSKDSALVSSVGHVSATPTTETIAGITVQFYLADDGHKICPASEESNVASIYTATGVAWYYILDTVNQRFKLPRTKFGATGLRDTVGNYVSESLPNVSGNCSGSSTNASDYSGPFVKGADFGSVAGGGWSNGARATFDLSVANSTYQDNAPVQQRATQMYLYFYVGSFTQTALENTAGLNAGLFNGKADLNLLNTTNNVDFVIDRQEPNAGNNYTWYRKYRSGWVEQGGVKSHSAGTIDITLVIPMADTDYSVLGSFGAGYGASNNNNFVLVPYSSTVIRLTDNNSGSMYWRVSGKAA